MTQPNDPSQEKSSVNSVLVSGGVREELAVSQSQPVLLSNEQPEVVRSAALAAELLERLQAIIDWADFAMANAGEFDSHGVRNLDGPVFDEARAAIKRATEMPS